MFNNTKYEALSSSSASDDGIYPKRKNFSHSYKKVVGLGFLLCALSGMMGFTTGRYSTRTQILTPAGNVPSVFEYNISFTIAPSNTSDSLWQSIFPPGNGFIIHPPLATNLSAFTVFHQLHCIDVLRHGYWAAVNPSFPGANTTIIGPDGEPLGAHHLEHCFDYLRQTVQCAADTNVEPVDFDLGGVTGWGVQRTCRDFEAVKRIAEGWRRRKVGI